MASKKTAIPPPAIKKNNKPRFKGIARVGFEPKVQFKPSDDLQQQVVKVTVTAPPKVVKKEKKIVYTSPKLVSYKKRQQQKKTVFSKDDLS